jgi:PKD repeat protein
MGKWTLKIYPIFGNIMSCMKKFIIIIIPMMLGVITKAQCTLEPFSLQKRTYISDLIIEGRVISSESYWNQDSSFIYSLHSIEIGKIFDGEGILGSARNLFLITEGGQIGLDALKVQPSLELKVSEVGIFFLKKSSVKLSECNSCDENLYKGVASEQSFLKYDELTLEAHGYFEKYQAIEAGLYPTIMSYTNKSYTKVSDLKIGDDGIKSLASPVISSLSLDTLTSGTGTVLTISGSNFGIIRDQGTVEFLDPNFGDGRYFDPYYPSAYKSWSSSKIEVYVPTRSGTGRIRVTNNNGEWSLSSDSIYVKYAHSNVGYSGTTGIDSGFYQVDHINDNSNGGYTWQFNSKFSNKSNAVNSFLRAAETWRCQTLMNWDVGDNTKTDVIARDAENVVRFTNFTDSRLGVLYSWYNGCFNGGKIFWYVSEMDVDFDSTRNWYYGTGKPGKSQMDFETVATHELGHGHQLTHVIDKSKIMHYSLTIGVRNVSLNATDIEGGEFVSSKSKNANPCGPGKYVPIAISDCNITKPEADYVASDTITCPNIDITFTDDTKGKVKNYSWNFGTDATPKNANTVGPHEVKYSTSGAKSVQLIVSNDFGVDTSIATILVSPDSPDSPNIFAYQDTNCVGPEAFKINSVKDATAYK